MRCCAHGLTHKQPVTAQTSGVQATMVATWLLELYMDQINRALLEERPAGPGESLPAADEPGPGADASPAAAQANGSAEAGARPCWEHMLPGEAQPPRLSAEWWSCARLPVRVFACPGPRPTCPCALCLHKPPEHAELSWRKLHPLCQRKAARAAVQLVAAQHQWNCCRQRPVPVCLQLLTPRLARRSSRAAGRHTPSQAALGALTQGP